MNKLVGILKLQHMFIKKDSNAKPLLADMHMDGIRFDPKILAALKALKANQGISSDKEQQDV